jgi:predicted PurR-regulated permease PerM
MPDFREFMQNQSAIALIISLFFSAIAIFLRSMRFIGFPTLLLLLFISITSGIMISNPQLLQYKAEPKPIDVSDSATFKNQITQLVKEVQSEVSAEKENLRDLMNQVDEIFDQLDREKQKLQSFISEARENFKIEDKASLALEEAEVRAE